MKLFSKLSFAFMAAAVASLPAHATLVVNDNQTATDLVNSLLAGSSGISVSNAQIIGASSGVQNGTFSGGNSASLGFDTGIVLSSGNVNNLPLSSNGADSGASENLGQPGDTNLNTLVSGGTNDASVLKFDFVPTGNQITFQYVFGSTEYNQYVNSEFNDVFAFFVNGTNEALIPGTSTPVSINNVNCGQSSGATSASSPGSAPVTNCDDFINNRNADGSVGANKLVNLGGFTKTFGLTAIVNPNVTNTMYIAVADTSDSILDSAVFLQGGTLSVCGGPGQPPCGGGTPSVPEPSTLWLMGAGLLGLAAATRRRRYAVQAQG